jgi:hypothetical protein
MDYSECTCAAVCVVRKLCANCVHMICSNMRNVRTRFRAHLRCVANVDSIVQATHNVTMCATFVVPTQCTTRRYICAHPTAHAAVSAGEMACRAYWNGRRALPPAVHTCIQIVCGMIVSICVRESCRLRTVVLYSGGNRARAASFAHIRQMCLLRGVLLYVAYVRQPHTQCFSGACFLRRYMLALRRFADHRVLIIARWQLQERSCYNNEQCVSSETATNSQHQQWNSNAYCA